MSKKPRRSLIRTFFRRSPSPKAGDDTLQLEMKINELTDLGYHLFPVTVGSFAEIDPDMVNYARNGGKYHALSAASQLPGLVQTLTPELYSVPEPATGGMLLAAGLLLASRRVSRRGDNTLKPSTSSTGALRG